MADNAAGYRRMEYKWLAMIAVSIGTFMSTLDASIVNISLPTIMKSLNTDLTTVQWVVAIYLLVITGLLLTLGRLADLMGRKPIYIAGFLIFTIGSVLCGLSRSVHLLITFRAIQAVGAAMIMANGPAIITSVFPASERGKALGIMGMVVATGLTVGPALGGLLISISGWPLIFFINLPIGIIGIIFAQIVLAPERKGIERHFDIPGAMLLMISLVSLSLALSEGNERGWLSAFIIALFGSSMISGIVFIIRELNTVHPILDLALFRDRLFSSASISALISYIAMFCVMFLMPFYLSQVLGYKPRQMGFVLMAIPITVAMIAPLSGALSDKIGSRILGSIGIAIMSAGLLLISMLGSDPSLIRVAASLIIVGLGSAIFQSPNNSAIMGSVPPGMLGVASGMLATMRNLGMVIGITLSSAIYLSRHTAYSGQFAPETANILAFRDAFITGSIIAAVGIFTAAARGRAARPTSASE
ncbi:MAG: MFS transporter [Armatimonadota bacterium]